MCNDTLDKNEFLGEWVFSTSVGSLERLGRVPLPKLR